MRVRRGRYDELSDEARAIIDEGLAELLPEDEIAALIQDTTGESMSKSAINRYKNNRWSAAQASIRRSKELAHALAEAGRINPDDPDTLVVTEQYLQAAFLMELQSGALDPVQKGHLVARLAELRIKRQKLDLDSEKQKLETERLELEREKLELQRRKEMLPGAVTTWGLILDYFAGKEPVILAQLQSHSGPIAARLQEYFEPAKHTEHAKEA
jgi:hypothetical protein